jgi:predicted ribosomally synthesized peptide with nif11-like leader
MSIQQLQAFIAHLQDDGNAQLRQSVQAEASLSNLEAVVAMAQQAGFAIEVSDIQDHHAQQTAELNDEELSESSGGASSYAFNELLNEHIGAMPMLIPPNKD